MFGSSHIFVIFDSIRQHCIRMHINYKVETGIEQKAAFPKRVIVFRDGVSEGQFKQVIDGG
jgi:Piwi domain